MIGDRPAVVERRRQIGHWEIDTVMGESLGESSDCILTLVERKTGYALIGKLAARTAAEANRALLEFMADTPDGCARSPWTTAPSSIGMGGSKRRPASILFATPHHSWERGTNENTNGLIRQYLPKGVSMKGVTQSQCDTIAEQLNNRPRKRHEYKTPKECFLAN